MLNALDGGRSTSMPHTGSTSLSLLLSWTWLRPTGWSCGKARAGRCSPPRFRWDPHRQRRDAALALTEPERLRPEKEARRLMTLFTVRKLATG